MEKMIPEDNQSDVKVSMGEKLAYAGGDAACNVVFGLTTTLLTLFYTDYMGISPAIIGTIMLVSRVFDGGSDVLMGILTERTHSRHGKTLDSLDGSSVCPVCSGAFYGAERFI